MQNIVYILAGDPMENTYLGRQIHRWEENIAMDIKQIIVNMSICMELTQDSDYWGILMIAQ